MDEKRKKLLCDILAEADKMRIEKTWPVSEDELEEHSDIRDSYEFGFLCGYFHCKEQLIKDAVEAEVSSKPNDYGEYMPEVTVPVSYSFREGEKVRVIIIKEKEYDKE